VRRLWLFGPHAAGTAAPGTPIDVLADIEGVLTYEQFTALQDELGRLLGAPAELVLKGDLDPSIAEVVMEGMLEIG
jgi:predicted nucleotidyltransferase